MNYISLKGPGINVNFREAVLLGQAPGRSLFFPESIPQLSMQFLKNLKQLSNEEIAMKVIQPFIGDTIEKKKLQSIISETINFDFPLVQIEENVFSLELFHGPTCAFKDVGARFMSGCLNYFSEGSKEKITILVATSGDTGGAVADAFFKSGNVDVIILYPAGKVSHLQKLQLTTYGENIKAVAVDGTFDDCQGMVKEAFADKDLNEKYQFSSANSINIARWLPQQFYYFFALKQWPLSQSPVISVPSGNLGNLSAGILSKKTGLDIDCFVAACNDNDVIVEYLKSGNFIKRYAVPTISNAMDVGNPSNFSRVLELLKVNNDRSSKDLLGFSFNSEETKNAIREVFKKTNYILDPHGAVGYLSLKKFLSTQPGKSGIFLETAHPAKFLDTVNPLVENQIKVPEQLQDLEHKKSRSLKIAAHYKALKEVLL